MEFRILGPLEVREEGEALPLGGAKQGLSSPSSSCMPMRRYPLID